MGLTPCTEATAADWITSAANAWERLATFGPEGFEAYARLRFIPDPTRAVQSENEAETVPDHPSESQQLETAVAVLGRHTTTPDRLFFAFWDGFGFAMPAATFDVPNRSFFLYAGATSELGTWDVAPEHQAPGQRWLPAPALIWPADHAWCLANDVDPHWAGIGAGRGALEDLMAEAGLDVVTANPAERQPWYV